jgi:2-aminoadipate transaminase|tara:strand:- start:773 stop:1906 length:1134 start_codon:yes stop_codon:yes gene_type:complete
MRVYDFGSGRTDPGSFPTEELAAAAREAVREIGPELCLYPGDMGHQGLREIMAARESEREGVDVSPDHISLMNGSMQAVTLVAEALMQGVGDIVVTEELTYSGTIGAYQNLGVELVGVPLDEHGMRTDALADTLEDLHRKGTPPRFIYTLATYQNPTGSMMPRARRLELLEVARRYDAVVVDDNCYGDVHFEGAKEPSLYALDDSPNIIYICSLSKILGPGVRVGYVVARPPMLGRLLDRRFDGGNSLLASSICAHYFRDRLWDHIERNNAILKEKRDAVFTGLEQSVGDICTWSRPVGGLFIWVEFPDDVDRDKLMALCAERNIMVARGQGFHIHREDVPAIRLAFGYAALEDIQEGVPLLGECIQMARAPAPVMA